MPEELEYTKKLLEIEYAQVRSRIDATNDIRFKLKGWAITLPLACWRWASVAATAGSRC
jgi:hypothetical protein